MTTETALAPQSGSVMEQAARIAGLPASLERAVIAGDLTYLGPEDRVRFYAAVCNSVGLNPLTQPFLYIQLNGKLKLYAAKDCTDQLRKIHGVSVTKLDKERMGDLYVVTAYGVDKTGRTDAATGAVTLGRLSGEALANAMMKAETKSKRRLTLSICGLGVLDETEVGSIPEAKIVDPDKATVVTSTAVAADDTPVIAQPSDSEGRPEAADSGSTTAEAPPPKESAPSLLERRAMLPADCIMEVPTDEALLMFPADDELQNRAFYVARIRELAEEKKLTSQEKGELLEQFLGNRRARLDGGGHNVYFLRALYFHLRG